MQDTLRVLAEATRVLAHRLCAFSEIVDATTTVDKGLLVPHVDRGKRVATNGPTMPLTRHKSRKSKFGDGQSSFLRVPQQSSLMLVPPYCTY
ncbi:hypothetical protein U1Q18_002290 [Sarracenia purpurea var. burkii]